MVKRSPGDFARWASEPQSPWQNAYAERLTRTASPPPASIDDIAHLHRSLPEFESEPSVATDAGAAFRGGVPVIFAMRYGRRLIDHKGDGVVSQEGPFSEHTMTVIGFDDARKAFRIQNSFGRAWGDGGYASRKSGSAIPFVHVDRHVHQASRDDAVIGGTNSIRPHPAHSNI
jgi:hypothetical protein